MRRVGVEVARAAMVVGASSLTVSALGFLKNILAAYFFGTSEMMDAYLLALVLPDIAMNFAGTGVFNFIPLFATEREQSEARAWRSAGRMLSYWLALLMTALLAALLLTPQILYLLAPGFAGGQLDITVSLTRLLFFMAASVGVARILAMVLYAQKRFLGGALSEAIFQVASTGFLLVFHSWGIAALVWGQILGGFLQLLVVSVALYDRRAQIRPSLDFRRAPVPAMVRLTLPVYVGNIGAKLNTVINRAFASLLSAGAISSLQYASIVVETPVRIISGSLTSAMLPFLSERFARKETDGISAAVRRTLTTAAVLYLPAAAGVLLLAEPLVSFLFERGSFDARSTELTVAAVQIFAPGILALGLNDLIGSVFHARQQPTVPMKAGLARVGLNLLLCFILVPSLEHRGVALAATISVYAKLAILLFFLRRILSRLEMVTLLRSVARAVPAAAAMFLAASLLLDDPSSFGPRSPSAWPGELLHLILLGLVATATYAAALRLLHREEFQTYTALLAQMLGRDRAGLGSAPGKAARGERVASQEGERELVARPARGTE